MNYNEYGGGHQHENDILTTEDVIVENYATGKDILTQAMDDVVSSHDKPATDDVYVEETLQAVENKIDDDYLITLGRASLESTARRMFGARKRKGLARITEANPQPELNFGATIPLHENAVMAIDEETSIPLNKAKKADIKMCHVYQTAKARAKIEEIEHGQRQLASSVGYLKDAMDDEKLLEDYDNGEGVAKI